MESFRIFRFSLLPLLAVCAPLAAQSVDTQSVTLTYNNGSFLPNPVTVHVSNAPNVSARIGTNIDSNGAQVSSGGDTPGVFSKNLSDVLATTAAVNIGTDSVVLGNLGRRGAATYMGTLLISATGCVDCISVTLTLNISNGGAVSISYNNAPIPASGIALFSAAGGTATAQITLTSTNATAFQITSSQSWLTVNPASGQLTGSQTISLTANSPGVPNGSTAVLGVSAGGITQNITVTLNGGTGGGLTLNPNPMNFQFITSTSSYPTGQTQYLTIS